MDSNNLFMLLKICSKTNFYIKPKILSYNFEKINNHNFDIQWSFSINSSKGKYQPSRVKLQDTGQASYSHRFKVEVWIEKCTIM